MFGGEVKMVPNGRPFYTQTYRDPLIGYIHINISVGIKTNIPEHFKVNKSTVNSGFLLVA